MRPALPIRVIHAVVTRVMKRNMKPLSAVPPSTWQAPGADDRERLESCLGRLYILDTEVSARELDLILEPVWQSANEILARLFGDRSLQFHMFRQPSYMSAVSHIVKDLPGIDEHTKYRHLISLFRDDLELALRRLDGPLERFA